MKSTMILPCGVSSALKPAAAGVTLAMSLVTSPLRNLRASSPATLTTPRSGSSAAFMVFDRTCQMSRLNVRRSLYGHKGGLRVGGDGGARSVAGDEEMPGAVRSDPETVEGVDAEFHHVLVVGAGDNSKQLDLLLGRQRGERHAHEIGPDIHFLRRAFIDAHVAGFQDHGQDREHLDAVRIGIVRLPERDRILLVGEGENRRRIVHQRRKLLQVAAARGSEQAFAGARNRRGQAGEIGDDFGNGGRRGEVTLALVGASLGDLVRRRRGGVRRLYGLAAKVGRHNHAGARDERRQQEPQANAQQHGFGGRSRIAASLPEARNRWRVAATMSRAASSGGNGMTLSARAGGKLQTAWLGAYCRARARENSPLRMRTARPSAKRAAASSP